MHEKRYLSLPRSILLAYITGTVLKNWTNIGIRYYANKMEISNCTKGISYMIFSWYDGNNRHIMRCVTVVWPTRKLRVGVHKSTRFRGIDLRTCGGYSLHLPHNQVSGIEKMPLRDLFSHPTGFSSLNPNTDLPEKWDVCSILSHALVFPVCGECQCIHHGLRD